MTSKIFGIYMTSDGSMFISRVSMDDLGRKSFEDERIYKNVTASSMKRMFAAIMSLDPNSTGRLRLDYIRASRNISVFKEILERNDRE